MPLVEFGAYQKPVPRPKLGQVQDQVPGPGPGSGLRVQDLVQTFFDESLPTTQLDWQGPLTLECLSWVVAAGNSARKVPAHQEHLL